MNLINATVRLKDDASWAESSASSGWPKIYGTVVNETPEKAQIHWPNGAFTWENKRDLYMLD